MSDSNLLLLLGNIWYAVAFLADGISETVAATVIAIVMLIFALALRAKEKP